jgi:hypothetical protein
MKTHPTVTLLCRFILLAFMVPGMALSQIIGEASGIGTIPSGEYEGQTFTITIKGEYSEFGDGTLITGEAVVQIGEERFESIVDPALQSFCCGEGSVSPDRFRMSGQVRHIAAAYPPHNHLFGTSAGPDGLMCMNIADQSGTIAKPLLPHDPGIGLICDIPATVQIGQATVNVVIDIKPGSFPNVINLNSKGVIPVAVLTTESFDATTVDPSSVKFGPNGATEAHGRGHEEDVNGDGDVDLMLHFATQATGIPPDAISASLIGKTFSGQDVEGSDAIVTLGGSSKSASLGEAEIVCTESAREEGFALHPSYPNPFNPSTVIRYTIPNDLFVTLKVYNSLGEEVAVLVNAVRPAGEHSVRFRADGLPSGLYFYRIQAGDFVETKKFVLLY